MACSSGSSSPTEPSTESISVEVVGSDDGAVGSSGGAEVDGAVTGVDIGAQTIFLITGDRVLVDQTTQWNPLGDLLSFDQLVNAVNANQNVRIEADGSFTQDGSLLAATIKAEIDEGFNDDDTNDDSDADIDTDDDIDSDDGDDSDAEDSDSEDSDSTDSDDERSGNSGPS